MCNIYAMYNEYTYIHMYNVFYKYICICIYVLVKVINEHFKL